MPDFTEEYLRSRSKELLAEKMQGVQIFDGKKEKLVPVFDPQEIHFGKILGRGGYCTVSTLDGVTLNSSAPKKTEPETYENDFIHATQDREFISDNFIRDGKHRYALKKLSPGLFGKSDPQHFVCGVIDLAMEVKFLSVLRHPNIIKMRAMADVDPCSKDFFVLLDSLDLTLDTQITVWKKNMPGSFGAKNKEKRADLFNERLIVGYDICSAFVYLHDNRIIYRDLKPANLGFDVRGDVKLFDFGLATELTDDRRHGDTDTYLLTKDTGSPRYMAPEVFLGKPYNETSDVYSFGMIFWQCLELDVPFSNYDIKKMTSKVYNGKEIPKIGAKWPASVKTILKNCWQRDLSKRGSCQEIKDALNAEIQGFDNDMLGALDVSNRTEMSIKNMKL